MEFQVSLTPKAEEDLQQIGRYIALDDAEAARRFCNDLFLAARSLRLLPYRGRRFSQKPNLLQIIHRSYLILYKVDDDARTVEVLRFWHAAQDRNRLRLRGSALSYATSVIQASH